jgi:hypothetical protein
MESQTVSTVARVRTSQIVRGVFTGMWLFAIPALTVFIVGCNDTRTSDDSAATATPATSTGSVPTAQAVQSYWKVKSESNAVTGQLTTTAYLTYQGKQNIYVRQTGKKLECYIDTDEFLETVNNLDSRNSTVQYKFDDGKVTRQTWTLSDDNNALFYPGNPKLFLAQMRHANTLAFEYRPADRIPQTITFDVTGFPDVFGK